MSIRYEGADAATTRVEVVPAGTIIGRDRLIEPALLFSYDEVFYLTGSKTDLLALIFNALNRTQQLADPSDTAGGDDADFPGLRCPTCDCRELSVEWVTVLSIAVDQDGVGDINVGGVLGGPPLHLVCPSCGPRSVTHAVAQRLDVMLRSSLPDRCLADLDSGMLIWQATP